MSAAQVLRQAEALKTASGDAHVGSPEAWVSRQSLQDMYQRLLIMDLEYALDKKVEQDLWNHAFKNQITSFQNQVKDKGNPKRGEMQATLGLFLDMASGFYLQLLQELCSAFKLDLPMRKRAHNYGILKDLQTGYTRMTQPKKSSSLYICQYCLVHLGDIARYRQQVEQAQTYYRHAASVVPYNGQPYNQLAILEAAKGNKLSTVFYYIRSIAVKHPFPVASTNLEKFYAKITKDNNEYKNKLSMNEIISGFLQFHALLHHCSYLEKAKTLSDRICQGFNTHIPSSFSAYQLLQMTAINLFALHHAKRKLDLGGKEGDDMGEKKLPNGVPDTEELSSDEKRSHHLILELLLHMLDVILQSSPKHEAKLKDHHTLPSLKIILDWLCSDQETLQHTLFNKYNGLWSNLAKNLNNLQFTQDQTEANNKYFRTPLPEDRDLHCFLPLSRPHARLTFHGLSLEGVPEALESHLRRQRLTQHGLTIAEEWPSLNLLNVHKFKSGRLEFSAQLPQVKLVPGESDSVLETRGARQNVAIQAIMQSRAKMNLSPTSSVSSTHSSGRDAGLEKSKSEPIMIVNQPDLLLAKLMAKNGGDVSQHMLDAGKAHPPSHPPDTSPAESREHLLERKPPKMAAVWGESAESPLRGSAEETRLISGPPSPYSPQQQQQQQQQTGAAVAAANSVGNNMKPAAPWPNTANPSNPASQQQMPNPQQTEIVPAQNTETKYFFGEPKTTSEMETMRAGPGMEGLRAGPAGAGGQPMEGMRAGGQQGQNPFGLSAFGPLVFQQPDKGGQGPGGGVRPIGDFSPAMVGLPPRPQMSPRGVAPQYGDRPPPGDYTPGHQVSPQAAIQRLGNPGNAYPGVGMGPQLPFTSWGIGGPRPQPPPLSSPRQPPPGGNRAPLSPWNPLLQQGPPMGMVNPQQGPPMRPGNPQQGPPMRSGNPQQGPLIRAGNPQQLRPDQPAQRPGPWGNRPPVMSQEDAALQQGSGGTSTPQRPIGPSPSQLPLPNFHPGGPGGSPQGPGVGGPQWETRQGGTDIHPTLRQLFQAGPRHPLTNSGVTSPLKPDGRERYPSGPDPPGQYGEGPDRPPYTTNNRDLPNPDSPGKIGSPGGGSMFSSPPENVYNSPTSGTYSLFNSQSPWSLPINNKQQDSTHSHSSSPFGSSSASNRTSPDHFSADERSPGLPQHISMVSGYGLVSSAEGPWPVNAPASHPGNSQPPGHPPSAHTQQQPGNMLANNLQALWSGPSALERLLEAQRQQKATDPH